MNKQIFLSLALGALVSFSPVQLTAAAKKADQPKVEQTEGKSEEPAEGKEASKDERTYVQIAKDAVWNKKAGYVLAALAATFVVHKVAYNTCDSYQDWVDGADENEEANKLSWTR